jgi:UDP-GlcNAc:undecaprenyl-phosphate/decaprenyl-phosphate GlcNAc-1-phosphate transferase
LRGEAVRDYILTLLVAAAVTYVLTPLVRLGATRIGALKQPRERDVHVVPVPTLGGLAMYGGLAAGLFVADQIPQLRENSLVNTGIINGLLLAGGLVVVIGVIDDRWGLSALTKGAGQVAVGGILVATGTQLNWLPLPGGRTFFPTTDQATLLTIVVVVGTINAVNFIDGLDGLAAGIVAIAAISFFIYYYSMTRVVPVPPLAAPALASAILIGMCIGFLPHNFSPASIFMGDTGAMLLGLVLAYAPISGISSLPPAELTVVNRYPVIMPLLLPAALLVIPYADLLLAVVRRTRAGQSPFAPDRKHLHHRLLDIGHSQRASVLIMYLWAAVFSGTVVWLSIEKTEHPGAANHHGEPVFVFVIVSLAAVAALLLMSVPRLRWWNRHAVAPATGTGPGPDAAAVNGSDPRGAGEGAGVVPAIPAADRPLTNEKSQSPGR